MWNDFDVNMVNVRTLIVHHHFRVWIRELDKIYYLSVYTSLLCEQQEPRLDVFHEVFERNYKG